MAEEELEEEVMEQEKVERNSIIMVPVKRLTIHPVSIRIYGHKKKKQEILDLAWSIKDVGLRDPITINSKYQILSGARRFYAIAKFTKLREVKAIMIEDGQDEG